MSNVYPDMVQTAVRQQRETVKALELLDTIPDFPFSGWQLSGDEVLVSARDQPKHYFPFNPFSSLDDCWLVLRLVNSLRGDFCRNLEIHLQTTSTTILNYSQGELATIWTCIALNVARDLEI